MSGEITGGHTGLVQTIASIDSALPAVKTYSPTGSNLLSPSVVLPVAVAGVLTTRTSDTAGIVTATDHGFIGDEVLGILWLDPTTGVLKCAYDASQTDGTVASSDTLTFADAVGDTLPVQDTAVRVVTRERNILSAPIPGGDDLLLLKLTSTQDAYCILWSGSGTSADTAEVETPVSPDDSYIYPINDEAVPFTNDIIVVDWYNYALAASTSKVEALLE